MKAKLSRCLIPLLTLILLAWPATCVQADGPTADAAHNCSDYLAYLMRAEDGSHFANTGECTSYVTHGGSLRIGHTEPVINAGASGFSITFNPLDGYIATGLIPDTTVRFTASAGLAAMRCDAVADGYGNISGPICLGSTVVPPAPAGCPYTAQLSIVDLTSGVVVKEVSASCVSN